ncbi:fumarylacetoacetate hydrolase family protein [Pseudomonas putida]|uniref:fumarylacetoacetate hydrolase family protein n=1 Tax=Pseudomonas putida TaxID=303 RepID=UPI00275EE701|nr:fumarylacetoacetate hydrolase family protein [Pseudomonas putida]MDP9522895.1 fumarylacetoacetate hydrolase family protein [Pseudomonas putida]
MKLATLKDGTRDGTLVVVARDLSRACYASPIAQTLQQAIEQWDAIAPKLDALYEALNEGNADSSFSFDATDAMAPLPRAYQWLDGSAFLNHGDLMQQAFGLPPIEDVDHIPLMYQGGSDDFLGPHDDIQVADVAHGVDFEGEFAVLLDSVPMGCTANEAGQHIKLLLQLNDVSLRTLAPREMKTGFGFVQAKPSTSFAPVAITPDELGSSWHEWRIHLNLQVVWNGARFGNPSSSHMHFDFAQLIAHAAMTRRLSAGTLIGSGTVSNAGGERGCTCISERRAIDRLEGRALTGFMQWGDVVRMQAMDERGDAPFGVIEQRVVRPVR